MNESKGILSASDILNAEDLDTVDVEVEAWGGAIRLQALSAAEAIKFTDSLKGDGKKNANVRIVLLSAIDEDGNRLFDNKELASLKEKNLRILNEIATKALVLNGLLNDEDNEDNLKND